MVSFRNALLLGLALALALAAAARAEPPGQHAFRTYGTRQGLSTLSVEHVLQDSRGYIWAGTAHGVFRFDGHAFEGFGTAMGLPSEAVLGLSLGTGADVWIATSGGLARWDGRRIDPQADKGLPRGPCTGVAKAGDRIFAATPAGLFRLERDGRFAPVPGWPGGEPLALHGDRGGALDVASGKLVHTRAADGTWTSTPLPQDAFDGIKALVRDRAGVLWARSEMHLFSLAPGAARFVQLDGVPPANERVTLALGRAGEVLVPTKEGLLRRDGDRWRWLQGRDGLPGRSAIAALEDAEGSLWVGATGLHQQLGRGLWRKFGPRDGLVGDTVWTIVRDREGRLLVGTSEGLAVAGADRFDMVEGTRGRIVRTVAIAPDGALWLGGQPGDVLRLSAGGAVERFPIDARIRVFRLAFDSSGTLWAGTDGGGLLRLAPSGTRKFERVEVPGGDAHERIRYLLQDRAGRLWVGGSRGLLVLDGGGWHRFGSADGLPDALASYLLERRNGELCAVFGGTGAGLHCFVAAGRTLAGVHHVHPSSGRPGNPIFLVGEDVRDRLWIGTGNGVTVLGAGGAEAFGEDTGLPSDDTDAMAFLAEPSGDVWIGTSSGLGLFSGGRYEQAPPAPRAPSIVAQLGALKLDADGPAQRAPHDSNTLSVRLRALTFLDPYRTAHQIRLLPLEREWHATAGREARYSALPAGSYVFEARTQLPEGHWSQPAQLPFEILPAWWQTAWFRLLLAFAGAGSVAAVVMIWMHRREGARKEAIQARAEASFRAMIESSPDVVVVHRAGAIAYANPTAARLLGYPAPEAMLGLPMLDLVHPDDRQQVIERVRAVATLGQPATLREERLVRTDGAVLLFEVSGLAVEFAGEPSVLAIARDITDRKRMESRLLLSDRMASLGTLAAGVAHEINNPLAYVIANLDELDRAARELAGPERAAELSEMLADVRDGADRVRKIVLGLKSFARGNEERREATDVCTVIERASMLAFHEIKYRARLVKDESSVPQVWADESRLTQVFTNLLINAAHAIPEGRPDENEIRVVVRQAPAGDVVVEVRDTGAGIPAALQGRIFDPFFTTKPIGVGTGLGLSICHGIVTGLGGEIGVESTEGQGSVFRVSLPPALRN